MHKYISSGKNVTAAGQVILDHTQVVNSINYANNALATLDLSSFDTRNVTDRYEGDVYWRKQINNP